MGSENETGRTLPGADWTSALLPLMLMSDVLEAALEVAVVEAVFLLPLAAVVVLKVDPLVFVLVAVAGMLLGVTGLLK